VQVKRILAYIEALGAERDRMPQQYQYIQQDKVVYFQMQMKCVVDG